MSTPDLVVLFEHPEWQKPLFAALEKRGIDFAPFDLKAASFDSASLPAGRLFFNQASPSAYLRGNTRAVPLALSLMRALELSGATVLNGSRAFSLELSKTAQAALMQRLGVAHPRSLTFNDVEAVKPLKDGFRWPALVKPEQGGSGARMHLVENYEALEHVVRTTPGMWEPDNLLLLQEYFPHDQEKGIVRMEFVGGELLYAMRVVSHGRFNLCPAPVCNPESGEGGACEIPLVQASKPPVEFYPYPEVPAAAVRIGQQLVREGGLDVAGIEYLEHDGRMIFYDVNANSNLRPSVAAHFGFDPFERVVDFLLRKLEETTRTAAAG
ncbi:MAG: RimK family alpha-L-glutamate ligase [Myxococcales bacterium]